MAELPLDQGIPRFKSNEDRVNTWVNGGENDSFLTSGGVNIPSIAKTRKELLDIVPSDFYRYYDTLALAQADIAEIYPHTAVEVLADPVPARNGFYVLEGGVLVFKNELTHPYIKALLQKLQYTMSFYGDVVVNWETQGNNGQMILPAGQIDFAYTNVGLPIAAGKIVQFPKNSSGKYQLYWNPTDGEFLRYTEGNRPAFNIDRVWVGSFYVDHVRKAIIFGLVSTISVASNVGDRVTALEQFKTNQDTINGAFDQNFTALFASATQSGDRLTSLETSRTAQAATNASVAGSLTTLSEGAAGSATRLTSLEASRTAQAETNASVAGRLTSLDQGAAGAVTRLNGLETFKTSQETLNTSIATNLTALSEFVTTQNAFNTTIVGKVDVLDAFRATQLTTNQTVADSLTAFATFQASAQNRLKDIEEELQAPTSIRVPGFGRPNALKAQVNRRARIISISDIAETRTAEGSVGSGYVMRVPGFGRPDAKKASVTSTGFIAAIANLVEDRTGSETDTTPIALRVPGFGRPDALTAKVRVDGKVAAISSASFEAMGSTYIPRAIYPRKMALPNLWAKYRGRPRIFLAVRGQSLGAGLVTKPGDALISTAPTYPGYARMPIYADGTSGVRVGGRRIIGWTDLVETTNGQLMESMCSALVNHFIRDYEAATGERPVVYIVNTAVSATEMDDLNEGSISDNDFLAAMSAAKIDAFREGAKLIFPGSFWQHGQNGRDRYSGAGRYEVSLKQRHQNEAAAARSILGQMIDPLMFMFCIDAGTPRQMGGSTYFMADTWHAQVNLCRSGGNFRMIGPDYWAEMSPDNLHKTCMGYYTMGMMAARALFKEICGTGHAPMEVEDLWWITTNALRLKINIPDNYNIGSPGTVYDIADPATVAALIPGGGSPVGSMFGMAARTPGAPAPISEIVIPDALTPIPNKCHLDLVFESDPGSAVALSYGLLLRETSPAIGVGRGSIASTLQYAPIHTGLGIPSGRDHLVPFYKVATR